MGRRIVFDIEANGLADVWDHATEIHCIVAKDIDTQEIFTFGEHPECQFGLDYFPKLLKKCDIVIGHNIISYDLKVLKNLLNVDFSIADTTDESEAQTNNWTLVDTVCGSDCFIDDTLVLSKTLNPDRMGHSLEDFGVRLGFHKIDWRQEAIELGLIEPDSPKGAEFATYHPRMLEYCIRDVEVNELIHSSLYTEWGTWNWSKAYWVEKAVAELVSRSEDHGFFFDQQLAQENVEWLTSEMDRLEAKVEPLLPRRPLPASRQPSFPAKPFTDSGEISAHGWSWLQKLGYPVDEDVLKFKAPPKTAFKQDGSVSKAGERYCEAAGVTNKEDMPEFLRECLKMSKKPPLPQEDMQKALEDLRKKRMPELTEPMQLSNQGDIKAYLVSMGWNPIAFKDKDLTVDTKKRKHDRIKFMEACERYVEETEGSPLEPFRLEHLKVNSIAQMRQKFLEHDLSKPLKVITQPIYTDGNDKEDLCPNLVKLGEKYEYVKDIVHWLTYRHRRNSILSPNGTGFLAHPRLAFDGRLPTPADTCGCASSRFQHKVVANIPRVTSLFGEPMRAMFCVPKDKVQIGCDADGLEARIEGHYCLPYNGKEYAEALVAAKPNDIHTTTAAKMGVERDAAKTMKYSCLPIDNTEVLTKSGWKRYEDLAEGETIFSYNTETGVVEEDTIKKIHLFTDEPVIKVGNKFHSFESTGDHRWWGWQRRRKGSSKKGSSSYKEFKFFTTDEINQEYNILCAAKSTGGSSEVKPHEAALVAWILSDGYLAWSKKSNTTSSSHGKKKGLFCSINQHKKKFQKEIEETLRYCGVEYSVHVPKDKCGSLNTYLPKSADLREFWDRVVGVRLDKHDVDWVKWVIDLSPESLEQFLYHFWLADGDTKGRKFEGSLLYAQNKGNINEALKTGLFLYGKRVTATSKGEHCPDCEQIRALSISHMTMQEVDKEVVGNKDVFCLTTNNGTFLIRQNGFYTITGNCSYGAQPPKIAKQMGWTLEKAKQVFNAFWEASAPLAELKKRLEQHWMENDKKWILGIDGRKLVTRSKHSLVNNLFQSAGVICMKRAAIYWDRWVRDEGLDAKIIIMYHDESQMEEDIKNVYIKAFDSEDSAKAWKEEQEALTGKMFSDIGHKGDKYWCGYSRAGELAALSISKGGKFYNIRVPLTGGYQLGRNWAQCH